MTTKRKTREWFGGAIEDLIAHCRNYAIDQTEYPHAADNDAGKQIIDAIREIELVEKVTGRSVLEALPKRRGDDE